eukprot:TRINITY_DN7041_c0_g2_i4.p2 TRINITY_DN7041_c0_g2~~TRINITY_DN7041_c0_g2_i4.p2  ORF type:complete len:131 (-),score=6.75 TRINITY_DN7041_c0_g2_i4:164-556(-)
MQLVPELDNIPSDKLPLKDLELMKDGIERSPLASFFQSPLNLAGPKLPCSSPQMQTEMLSLSGMNSSRFNQPFNSPPSSKNPPNVAMPLDFSSFVNAYSLQNVLAGDSLSPNFLTNRDKYADSFYKIEDA